MGAKDFRNPAQSQGVAGQFLDNQWRKKSPEWANTYQKKKVRKEATTSDLTSDAGMTTFVCASPEDRVPVLYRCGYDDTIISENWGSSSAAEALGLSQEPVEPAGYRFSAAPKEGEAAAAVSDYVATVVTEGVSQPQLVDYFSRLVGVRHEQVYPLTPMPVLACTTQTLLFKKLTQSQAAALADFKHTTILKAAVFLTDVRRRESSKVIAANSLPGLEYSVMVRDATASYAALERKLQDVVKNGFVNYTNVFRHGEDISQSIAFTQSLLDQNYIDCVIRYMKSLAEGSQAVLEHLGELEKIMRNSMDVSRTRVSKREWTMLADGVRAAIQQEAQAFDGARCGLHSPHLRQLQDLLDRGPSSNGDTAQLIRQGIPRQVMSGRVAGAVDVHWNAFASTRMRVHGPNVVPGDLVCVDPALMLDTNDHFEDVVPDFVGGYRFWRETPAHELAEVMHVVKDAEDAKRYSLRDVVLPKVGQFGDHPEQLKFPEHRVGKQASESLVQRLSLRGIHQMRLSPTVTYRRLVEHPEDLQMRCWNDSLGFEHGGQAAGVGAFVDAEGVRRQLSPLGALAVGRGAEGPSICRPGVRNPESRQRLLEVAKQGICASLRCSLPRGSPITSLLREVFVLGTIEKDLAFSLLHKQSRGGRRHSKKGPRRRNTHH